MKKYDIVRVVVRWQLSQYDKPQDWESLSCDLRDNNEKEYIKNLYYDLKSKYAPNNKIVVKLCYVPNQTESEYKEWARLVKWYDKGG